MHHTPKIFRSLQVPSNNAFLHPKLKEYGDIYTCVNYLVAKESATQINLLNKIKVLPFWLSSYISPVTGTFWVEAKGFPEFSTDIRKNISWRHTVTFYNLQLAVGLGYSKIVLIGVDNSYKQPASVQEGQIIIDSNNDQNHFSPKYFNGKEWQAADTDKMADMYSLVKIATNNLGIKVVDCTVDGKLQVFPKSDLEIEVSEGSQKTIYELEIDSEVQEGTLSEANELFRNKIYAEALKIYNYLSEKDAFYTNLIRENKELAIKKLMQTTN